MKFFLTFFTAFSFFPAMASTSCPSLVSYHLTDYVFDDAYEDSGYKYRKSNVELLKGELSTSAWTLHPDEYFFDPELPDLGGCSYYNEKEQGPVFFEVSAIYWPSTGTLDLTIVRTEEDRNGKKRGNYITAQIRPDSAFYYDETYGSVDDIDLKDHKFADIESALVKLVYAE